MRTPATLIAQILAGLCPHRPTHSDRGAACASRGTKDTYTVMYAALRGAPSAIIEERHP
jgi:hypothetical protein